MTKYSKTNFVTTQICPYNLRFSNCTNIAIPTNIANPIHCNCPKRLHTCMSWRWSAKNWRLHHFLNFTIFWTSPPSFSCCCSPLSWMITIVAYFAIKRFVSGSLIKFHSLIWLNWLTSNAFQKWEPGNMKCDSSMFFAPRPHKILQQTRCFAVQRMNRLPTAQEHRHLV